MSKEKKMRPVPYTVTAITTCAMLMALGAVLKKFSIPLAPLGFHSQSLSFLFFIPMLAGILYGPMLGGLVGMGAELIGALVLGATTGPYFPGFTLSAALCGVLPGLVFMKRTQRPAFWQVGLVVIATQLIASLGLNTWFIAYLRAQPYLVIFVSRVPLALATAAVYAVLMPILLRVIPRVYTHWEAPAPKEKAEDQTV
nr:folate family ECF transporter S component [bacterium]